MYNRVQYEKVLQDGEGQIAMQIITEIKDRISRVKGPEPPLELRLGKQAIIALIIHGFFQIGASMSGLFLNLYLWRLTEDLAVNAVYNIVMFATTPLAFALGGWISKRKDRMFTYRLGIFMIAIFYLLVVIVQEQVVPYFILFALFNSLASGFYWTGYLVLQYDVSTDVNRARFLAINMVTFNAAGIAGPALAGSIIQRAEGLTGYIFIFSIASIMFLIAAIISFRIPVMKSHHKAYYLKYMGLVMQRNKQWVKGLFSFLVLGLLQGIMLFLPNIMLFRTVGREDWVGYLGVFFSLLIVATGYVISRRSQKENISKYMIYSVTGVALGSIFLLIEVQLWSVILFMILYSICNPVTVNSLTSYYYSLISGLPLKGQLRVESVVMRELFLNIGRVISIVLLIVLVKDLESAWLPVVLLAMALMQYMLILFVRRKSE